MRTTCAFCGLAPLDGSGCCTADYRASAMRRADADLRRMQSELAALRRRAEDAEMMLRAATSHIGTSLLTRWRDDKFWLNDRDGRHIGELRMDPRTKLPVLNDEAREALKSTNPTPNTGS